MIESIIQREREISVQQITLIAVSLLPWLIGWLIGFMMRAVAWTISCIQAGYDNGRG